MPEQKVCCVTGHRQLAPERKRDISAQLETEISQAINDGFSVFLSGFADGVDLMFAEVVLKYKADYPHIFLEAAIPYPNRIQNGNKHFQQLLAQCDGIRCVSDQYHRQCFEKRNRYMVQSSERVNAVYDGRERGGTLFTMRYAHCLEKEVRLIQI